MKLLLILNKESFKINNKKNKQLQKDLILFNKE